MEIPEEISIKSLLEFSPAYFIQKIWGFRVDSVHGQMLDFLINERRGLLLCPRGHGKSKINQSLISHYILNNPNERVILVSESDAKAQSFLRGIKMILESSPLIKEIYGDVRGDRWTDHEITIKGRTVNHSEPSLMCVGSNSGSVTGRHCEWLVIDDLISYTSTRSELLRDRTREWYLTSLLPVLMSGGKISVCGTRYHNQDIYSNMIEELKYKTLILPAITLENKALIPWLVPLKDYTDKNNVFIEGLETIRENLGSVIFATQYQNDVSLINKDNIIQSDYIQYYNGIEWNDNKLYINNMGSSIKIGKIIMGVDPAISEKEKADFTAMVVIGKGSDGNFYVLDTLNKHLTFNKQIESVKYLAGKWQINQTNIEQVAYQEALIQELKRKGGLKINPIKPTRDKIARLNMVSGFFESHKVHFDKKNMNQIINQLLTFTGEGKDHDDLVDACVYSLWGFRSTGSGLLVLRM
jgi:predicted phage terminase large subunit-like protein